MVAGAQRTRLLGLKAPQPPHSAKRRLRRPTPRSLQAPATWCRPQHSARWHPGGPAPGRPRRTSACACRGPLPGWRAPPPCWPRCELTRRLRAPARRRRCRHPLWWGPARPWRSHLRRARRCVGCLPRPPLSTTQAGERSLAPFVAMPCPVMASAKMQPCALSIALSAGAAATKSSGYAPEVDWPLLYPPSVAGAPQVDCPSCQPGTGASSPCCAGALCN